MKPIPFGMPIIGDEERQAVASVLSGPILVHGPLAHQFENDFRNFVGGGQATSVSSATAALHLSYFYLGLGPGDEVIVPAQTHVATAHAVELCGALPVFVDAELATGNIDIDKIESAITTRTRAISIVHFLGMPVDMDRVNEIAKRHNLFVVEDCALAMGTFYKGQHAGLLGDVGCFSFYPVKHMTTSEGGMLLSKDSELVAKITRQKAFGVDRTVGERKIPGVYDVTMLGFNYRMSEIEAAIGIEQLKKMPGFLEKRKSNFELLAGQLAQIPEITLFKSSSADFQSSYYCLSVLLNEKYTAGRFEIVSYLNQHGVGTSVYYPKPVPHMKYYGDKYGFNASSFPNAAKISNSSIALSVGPHLGEEEINFTAQILKDALNVKGM